MEKGRKGRGDGLCKGLVAWRRTSQDSSDQLCGLGAGSQSELKDLGAGRCKVMLSQAKEFGLHSIGKTNSKKDSWERQNPFSQGLTLR